SRLAERDAAQLQKVEHEIEMLKLLDGDGVQLLHARIKVAILFQVQRGRGGFAFQMRVVNEHSRQIFQNFRQPVGWNLFAEQEHEGNKHQTAKSKHQKLFFRRWSVLNKQAMNKKIIRTGRVLLLILMFATGGCTAPKFASITNVPSD